MDVYEQIRQKILTGKLAPGTPLRPSELGADLSVSVGVVREALTRLAAQRLVDSEHNRGFHVITLSPDKLKELVSARQLNECRALELAIERGDVNWEGNVVAAHHRLVNTPVYTNEDDDHTNDAFLAEHKTFHFALLNGCGNRYLLDICNQLFDAAEVYRRWSAPMIDRRSNAAQEHRAIMDAALARQPGEAARLYAEHIGITAELVVQRFDSDITSSGRV
ncbi:GntR family transcriptional regulator [Rhodococcus triatomae BKS 15-14]|nr:GntR family transcriptional regulator [Rhodococcus triatomae BKS 15-14]